MGSLERSGKRLTAYTCRDLKEGYAFLAENSASHEKPVLVSHLTLEKTKGQVLHQASYYKPKLPQHELDSTRPMQQQEWMGTEAMRCAYLTLLLASPESMSKFIQLVSQSPMTPTFL